MDVLLLKMDNSGSGVESLISQRQSKRRFMYQTWSPLLDSSLFNASDKAQFNNPSITLLLYLKVNPLEANRQVLISNKLYSAVYCLLVHVFPTSFQTVRFLTEQKMHSAKKSLTFSWTCLWKLGMLVYAVGFWLYRSLLWQKGKWLSFSLCVWDAGVQIPSPLNQCA